MVSTNTPVARGTDTLFTLAGTAGPDLMTMNQFRSSFVVDAPLANVAAFHSDTSALKRLTPPPIFVQLHATEPLTEGASAEFTMWFGPLPLRWKAVHSNVDPLHGFTDTQVRGPLAMWEHQHRFTALDSERTRVSDKVLYSYGTGWRGWLNRLLFNPIALRLLFAYRRWITRRGLRA